MTSKKKLKREIQLIRSVNRILEANYFALLHDAEHAKGETVTSTHKPGDPWQAVRVPPSPGPVVIHSPRFAHDVQEDDGA